MARAIPTGLTAAQGRKFALTLATAFAVFALLAAWRGRETVSLVLGALGFGLGLAGLVIPSRLGPLFTAWMGLARALSIVTTPVFLGIVYFAIITPIGLLMRVLGRNPIDHKPTDGSFWVPRDDRRGTMDHQF